MVFTTATTLSKWGYYYRSGAACLHIRDCRLFPKNITRSFDGDSFPEFLHVCIFFQYDDDGDLLVIGRTTLSCNIWRSRQLLAGMGDAKSPTRVFCSQKPQRVRDFLQIRRLRVRRLALGLLTLLIKIGFVFVCQFGRSRRHCTTAHFVFVGGCIY